MIETVEMFLRIRDVCLDRDVLVLSGGSPLVDASVGVVPVQKLRDVPVPTARHLQSGKYHCVVADRPVERSLSVFE